MHHERSSFSDSGLVKSTKLEVKIGILTSNYSSLLEAILTFFLAQIMAVGEKVSRGKSG